MAKNFGQMKASIDTWAREYLDDLLKTDALNDAIEALWMSALQSSISTFVGGPVTTLTLAAASERTQLVSIADPTVAPVVNNVVQGALAQHQPFIAYTLVTESGSETNMSPTVNPVIPVNNIAQTNSPGALANSIGYNVYAGSTAALMCRQNKAPIPFGQLFYEPATGFVDAPLAPLPPTENTTADDIFYIKMMEVNLSSGGHQKWREASIDSTLMQYASRSIASTSEYQNYYWDLINGRQLEYRPALGASANPRYFFVHKPRRIAFDSATLPFTTFPCEAYLRYKSLALIKLSLEEWASADRWNAYALAEELKVQQLLTMQTWNKDQTITPYMY